MWRIVINNASGITANARQHDNPDFARMPTDGNHPDTHLRQSLESRLRIPIS
jgi:hypothetical protein